MLRRLLCWVGAAGEPAVSSTVGFRWLPYLGHELFKELLRMALLGVVLWPSGCGSLPWAEAKSGGRAVVLCDATSPSVCSPTALPDLLHQLSGEAADHDGSVRLYQLDAAVAAVPVALFAPMPSVSRSQRALAQHHAQAVAEASRLFDAVLPGVFAGVQRTSPLAAAVLSVAVAESSRPLTIWVLSDAREASSAGTFEAGSLPSAQVWRSQLAKLGYTSSSLADVTVRFVGTPLMLPGDASPARGIAVRKLWEELRAFGATVTFTDEPPASAGYFLLFGGVNLAWRRLRAWIAGRRDAKSSYFAPRLLVESILGPPPIPEADDPRVADAGRTAAESRTVTDELVVEIKELTRRIAQHPIWLFLVFLLLVAAGGDFGAALSLFADFGIRSPDRIVAALAFVISLFVMAGYAATTFADKPPKWFYLVIGSIVALMLSLTVVRILNAADTGEPIASLIARGVIQCAAVAGPAMLAEHLLAKLRLVMPLVRLRWSLKSQLRKARREYRKALAFLTQQAHLTRAYRWQATVLEATYTRSYVSGGGKLPPSEEVASSERRIPAWPA